LIENVSEKDSEEEKVDDSEEFEKFVSNQNWQNYSISSFKRLNYYKFQLSCLEVYLAVVSPPPDFY